MGIIKTEKHAAPHDLVSSQSKASDEMNGIFCGTPLFSLTECEWESSLNIMLHLLQPRDQVGDKVLRKCALFSSFISRFLSEITKRYSQVENNGFSMANFLIWHFTLCFKYLVTLPFTCSITTFQLTKERKKEIGHKHRTLSVSIQFTECNCFLSRIWSAYNWPLILTMMRL